MTLNWLFFFLFTDYWVFNPVLLRTIFPKCGRWCWVGSSLCMWSLLLLASEADGCWRPLKWCFWESHTVKRGSNKKRSTSLKNNYKDKLKCNKKQTTLLRIALYYVLLSCSQNFLTLCAQIFIIPHFSVALTGDPPIGLSVCYFFLLAFVHQRMLDKWTPILCNAWLPLICCMCSTMKRAFRAHTASKVYHLCRVSLLLTGRVCKWNQN